MVVLLEVVFFMVHCLSSGSGQSAREIRSAPKEEERPSQVSGEDLERIAKLESETASLRSQVSDVRNGLQDVKEQLRQIMLALGIEPDE